MEDTVQTLTWQIDGEFITDLARGWFWDEDKPYSTCEELLLECMVTDQIDTATKKRLITEILEGRKKLVGINTFYLEDDNENVRPLSLKLEQKEFQNGVLWVKSEMQIRAIDFVDPYSTLRSIKFLRESDTRPCCTFEDCFKYFAHSHCGVYYDLLDDYDVRYEEYSTKLGLWLFFYPEIAWKATKGRSVHIGSRDFWDNVYEQVKDWKWDKSFIERNERYLADRRMSSRQDDTVSRAVERGVEKLNNIVETAEPDSRQNFAARVSLHSIEGEREDDKLLHVVVPDDIIKWEGLISPTGDFYSCTFGGHNLKAYNIMQAYPDKFPNADRDRVFTDRALDSLVEAGWCATRFLPGRGEYIEIPSESSGKRVTKAQINTIWDAIVKHDAHPGNMDLLGF